MTSTAGSTERPSLSPVGILADLLALQTFMFQSDLRTQQSIKPSFEQKLHKQAVAAPCKSVTVASLDETNKCNFATACTQSHVVL